MTAPTIEELLSFGLRRPAEGSRASALVDLVPLLDPARFDVVLEAAAAIRNHHQRSRVLLAVAARGRPEQARRVVAATLELAEPSNRGLSLAMLVAYLDPADRAPAIEAALDAIDRIDWIYFLTGAVERLAPHLTPPQVDRAIAAGLRIAKVDEGGPFLARLAPYLTAHLLDRAVAEVSAIEDGNLRAVTLKTLASAVPEARLSALVDAANAIEHGHARARALAGLAPHLPEPRRRAAIEAALAATRPEPGGDPLRGIALGLLLPLLDRDQVSAVLRAAGGDLAEITAVAPFAAPDEVAAAVAAAIASPRLDEPPTDRPSSAHELARVVPYLPADQRIAAAQRWISLLERQGDYVHVWALSLPTLAEHFTADQLDQVLGMIDPHVRPIVFRTSIGFLAPHLDRAQLDVALDAALALDDEPARGEALAELAPFLGPEPLERATAAALSLRGPEHLVDTIAQFPPPVSEAAVQAALDAASRIGPHGKRARSFLTLAAALPVERRETPLAHAYAAMIQLPESDEDDADLTANVVLGELLSLRSDAVETV